MKKLLLLFSLLLISPLIGNQDIFTEPGIATMQGGRWVGSEHLYNLSPNIGIQIEVIASSKGNVPQYSEETTKQKVTQILTQGGIRPRLLPSAGPSPLPFLNLLVMLQPIERGYVAYCAIRLFEEIKVGRIHLKPRIIWQGITWEKQELILSPQDKLQEQIDTAFQTLAQEFVDRFRLKP